MTDLASGPPLPFPDGSIVVAGASGGIGRALVEALAADGRGPIHALSRSGAAFDAPVRTGFLDVTDEGSIAAAAESVARDGPVGLVLVATGLLHADGLEPEKTWRALDGARLARLFAVNATGPALVAKHLLPLLPRRGRAVFAALSAKVGSIEDNRLGGWHGYRASKAALNQIVRTLAIELARTRPEAVALALHPGTVATGLSAPFRAGVPAERLFSPPEAARHLLEAIDRAGPEASGRLWGWDGAPFPF